MGTTYLLREVRWECRCLKSRENDSGNGEWNFDLNLDDGRFAQNAELDQYQLETIAAATVPLCQHWMDDTTRCRCPAMRGMRYCYSHSLQQERVARKNAERARQRWFESVPLDDAASIQRAIREVMIRLLSGDISRKQAGQILYKLQTASANLRTTRSAPEKADDEA